MTRETVPVLLEGEEAFGLLERLRALVARHLGLQLDPSQDDRLRNTLHRLAGPEAPAAWLTRLERFTSQADQDAMAAALTVGETYFFRHAEQLDALRTVVLPRWVKRHPAPRRLRALCAGCASGEEAYTLAMTLQRSVLGPGGVDWDITAFDINAAALQRARTAHYNAWSLRATPPAWRDLWFRPDGAGWTPLPSLRRRVQFHQRQIALPDPGFWRAGHFDIIFCRNMLMYLEAPSLRQAVQHLATALAPGGALFLGHAETLHSLTDQLVLQQGAGCFFHQRRDDVAAASQALVPHTAPRPSTLDPDWLATHRAGAKVSAATGADAPAPDSIWDAPFPTEWPTLDGDEDSTRQLDRALQLVETGHVNDGLRVCASLITPSVPADIQADALYIQALALEERGELPAAEWHHQRAAAKDAHFAMPHLRLGLLARRRGEPVAARRELRCALELLDTESPARLRRFGGGFERQALRQLCTNDLGDLR
ncbi:CheR family methyltransferase [Roseateles terrae]|uniref:Chemotaxis protein methyltransferase CheR n=1 Tax=Roseateles terrae TaxID=431060 RepID=A0ABR6GZJ2_9BURK|nr:protein-glutamate O-methyltransferase CheR [Roseateles terrae]MBB3197176.1 chemotaxis protein methyltransferase CheR [Roseateles terrae]OWQ84322.1 hypothetical protein CDN98_20365 [Roseateles terrae]